MPTLATGTADSVFTAGNEPMLPELKTAHLQDFIAGKPYPPPLKVIKRRPCAPARLSTNLRNHARLGGITDGISASRTLA